MPLTITEAAQGLRAREFSSRELLTEVTRYADHFDPLVHAYSRRFDDTAHQAAAAADQDFASGIDRGALQGIPVGIKDIIFTREASTRAGSDVRNVAWEAPLDATVVARLRDAGAVITGKTTTAELAVGMPEADRLDRECRNPWDTARWAGGSSAGSSAGVVAGMFLAGIGTDTGGSIRLPAAYCGIVGLRPTFGLVSRAGTIPLSPSLDVVGPITRTARDAALVLQALAGPDPRDPSAVARPVPDFSRDLGRPLQGLRVGAVRAHHSDAEDAMPELADRFDEAVGELQRAGAVVREIELPDYEAGVSAVLVTLFADAFAYHASALREQWSAFGVSTRRALANGALLSAADYVMAQKVRRAVRRLVSDLYREVDVIICATALADAPLLEAIDLQDLTAAIRTDYWSAVGNPVASVPIGFSDRGMPLGMQIAGRHFDDATVLRVADGYERLTGWHRRVSPTTALIGQSAGVEGRDHA
jgi:aspartyl-tRNA(Asn)/glutamyl-tRNA(Gln) amidotransferase subunit A